MSENWYFQILRIDGSEMLKAEVIIYTDGTSGLKGNDVEACDIALEVEVGCIKVVFVNKFVNSFSIDPLQLNFFKLLLQLINKVAIDH